MAKKPNDLPPWLQDDDDDSSSSQSSTSNPPPSSPKPITPPPPKRAEGPSPWLAGLDEEGEEVERSEMLKGSSINQEWLASAQFLPDSAETELTYDEWYARQQESKREKSIEEEIPDFLETDDIESVIGDAPKKETGMLPDWFLGMESLKEDEEPEWMRTGDTFTSEPPATVAPVVDDRDLPGWMQRNTESFEDAAIPKFSGFSDQPTGTTESGEPDAIQSFFDSLGAAEDEEDELPPEFSSVPVARVSDGTTAPLTDDFESNLNEWNNMRAGGAAAAAGYETLSDPPAADQPEDESIDTLRDLFGDLMDQQDDDVPPMAGVVTDPSMLPPDIDAMIVAGPDESWFDEDPQYAADTDEIPESAVDTGVLRDLDSFFGGVAATRAEQEDEVEEPDLEWFLNEPDVTPTQMERPAEMIAWRESADQQIPVDAPMPVESNTPEPASENTLSWLNELSSIVNKATGTSNEPDMFEIADDEDDPFAASPANLPPPPSFEDFGITPEDDFIQPDYAQENTLVFSARDMDDHREMRAKLRTSEEMAALQAAQDAQNNPSDANVSGFDWSSTEAAADPEPVATEGMNWMSAFDTETIQAAQAEQPSEPETPAPPTYTPSGGLTGMLSRFNEPEPEPDPNATSDVFDLFSSDLEQPADSQRSFTPLDADFVAPPSLNTMFDTDALHQSGDQSEQAEDFGELPDLFTDVSLTRDDASNALNDFFASQAFEEDTPATVPAPKTDSSEFPMFDFSDMTFENTPAQPDAFSAPTWDEPVSEAEANFNADLNADAFTFDVPFDNPPAEPQAPTEQDDDDFFSLIQHDPESNLLPNTGALSGAATPTNQPAASGDESLETLFDLVEFDAA